jgi:hypothetical protein
VLEQFTEQNNEDEQWERNIIYEKSLINSPTIYRAKQIPQEFKLQ